MDWLKTELSPELEFQVEVATRSMEPREAMLYRTCALQREQLQQAIWEIMRLDLCLDDLRMDCRLLAEQLAELLDESAQLHTDPPHLQ